MWKYSTLKYIFWPIFIGVFLYSFIVESLGIWVFVGLILCWLSYIVFGVFRMEAGIFLTAVCRLPHVTKKNLILTFDDGPDPDHTPEILDILKLHQAQAVFFCIGKNIQTFPEIVKRIVAEGHIVANHSFHHSNFIGSYSTQKVVTEIQLTENAIIDCIGESLQLYRPPVGVTNPNIAKAIKKLNMTVLGWSVRSFDTVSSDKNELLRRITSTLKNGDIILLHDTKPVTKDILADFLLYSTNKGFTFDINPVRAIK
ncbi:polysaccharide deacetylase family protein [uncultured Cytophaga sp.]|uniref:polysaccharide deacetylase family protein n=1 Tax=uncultured Cytophaga sp. TaxID=160238 RepID=UPI0026103A2D|nr:polysaccharide deacetylase family protein [uncultured Cytophaga sp.]